MLNIENEMQKVILFFTFKHKGNWEKIYNAIKTRESISLVEIDMIRKNDQNQYKSIVDKDYPDNFKDMYMPPLSIFMVGNEHLLDRQDSIHSLWSANNYKSLSQYEFQNEKIYAVAVNNDLVPVINSLTKKGVKLIVLKANSKDDLNLAKLDFNANLLYLSEIPLEISDPSIAKDQSQERLLLGISKFASAIDIDDNFIKKVYPLFEFEKRYLTLKNKASNSTAVNYKYILPIK